MAHLELAARARRDLRRLPTNERNRVRRALERLAEAAETIDVKPLSDRPWWRLRVGNLRIIYRQLTHDELVRRGVQGLGSLVERIVNRRDFERALRTLK
jgi:mRNA-degrading endonuclease RelE of RelBE toxin-antitoxin system